jgi:hypothetical protein
LQAECRRRQPVRDKTHAVSWGRLQRQP